MKIQVQLTVDSICPSPPPALGDGIECGAEIEFQGKVRASEKGQKIAGLQYEAYEPMARIEIERLLKELAVEFPCQSAEVIHRLGWVPAHETSLYIRISSKHRLEGFQLLTQFLDRMKQDVPIWKVLPQD